MTRLGYTVVREAQRDDGNYDHPPRFRNRPCLRCVTFDGLRCCWKFVACFEVALRFSVFFLTSPEMESCLFEVYICASVMFPTSCDLNLLTWMSVVD